MTTREGTPPEVAVASPVDPVTGGYSRTFLDIRLGEELSRAQRDGHSCSVCLFDIDHFKSVNDAFGHARGDAVLRQLVERVSALLRGSDAMFRYGGDEFVLLLPDADAGQAAAVATRMVDAIGQSTFDGVPPLRISVSLGVATFPADAADAASLVAVADHRSYLAKRSGRACVVVDDVPTQVALTSPRLLERDTGMAMAQAFLARLAVEGAGTLRVGGPRGAGHSRFLAEVAKLAGLRGLEVVRLGGPATGRGWAKGPTSAQRSTAGVLYIADGEAQWPAAARLAEERLGREPSRPVGLVLSAPAGAATFSHPALPLTGMIELVSWSSAAIRVWLRTRLHGEPTADLTDFVAESSGSLPARAERTVRRLLTSDAIERTPEGVWTLALDRVPARAGRTVPLPFTEILGRGREIDELGDLLAGERMVTLVGPGGIGKTRLAVAVASAVEDRYDDGAVFVSLAETPTAEQVEWAVAQALGVSEAPGEPLHATISTHLAGRRLLLVLDNFEHVQPAAGQVVEWLAAAPDLRVLVTSREKLKLSAERVYAVPVLSLPRREADGSVVLTVADALAESAALSLFHARARRVAHEFTLSRGNLPAVVELCHRLDGLPLAIELAAARVDSLTPEQLLVQVGRSLDLLVDGPVDLPARQQTLRAAIDWSYQLLENADRDLFAALGTFVGGARVVAVEAVSPGAERTARLGVLVDKNLLQVQTDPDGEIRFTMLETIRAYAHERLVAGPEAQLTHRRHAAYYASLADTAGTELLGPNQAGWRDLITREHHNIRAALSRSLRYRDAQVAGRIAAGIWVFWATRDMVSEGRDWLHRVLETGSLLPPALHARVLYGAGTMSLVQGDVRGAQRQIEECLSQAREVDDHATTIQALRKLGRIHSLAGEYPQAQALCEESLVLARAEEDGLGIATALVDLGDIAIRLGQLDRARVMMTESLGLLRAAGHTLAILDCVASLGEIAMFQGDVPAARPLFEESLVLSRELGDASAESWVLHHLGRLAELDGDQAEAARLFIAALRMRQQIQERQFIADSLEALAGVSVDADPVLAARMFGAAEEVREHDGLPRPPVWTHQWEGHVKLLDSALDAAARNAAWASGRTAPLAEVVAEALALGDAR
ncbi:MAG: diguanylate cyclase [Actinomycetota bacterium]|nr:diguanylate cyclase [Actinomycetota bacterium]